MVRPVQVRDLAARLSGFDVVGEPRADGLGEVRLVVVRYFGKQVGLEPRGDVRGVHVGEVL